MTPYCHTACIICDIDGFTGINSGISEGEAPPDFCTFIVHNARWIAFIAGSTYLKIKLSVSNCLYDHGLEIAIYKSLNCQTYQKVSNCWGAGSPVSNNSSATVESLVPLTVGQYYYIVIDGNAGDVCNWTLEVVEGSTLAAPLLSSGPIEGPVTACPGANAQYSPPGVEAATQYTWTINGAWAGTGLEFATEWTTPGIYELCVTASNACDEAPPTCQLITVASIPPTVFEEILCAGDCFTLNDTIELCEEGFYEFHFLTDTGCDSTVLVSLTVVEPSFTNLAFDICEGDSIYIGNTPLFEAGTHEIVFHNYQGCDSTISVELGLIVCEMKGEVIPKPVVCFGEASGQLTFFVKDGTPPFDYSWEQLGGSLLGSGALSAVFEEITLENLPAATYLISINDQFGNDVILIGVVDQPSLLTAGLTSSSFNGYEVSCFGGSDGQLTASISGGVPPYFYTWSNGADSPQLSGLLAGSYSVTVTDTYGCSRTLADTLSQPSRLLLEAFFTDPDCEGPETGIVQVISLNGGIPPYSYDNTGSGFSDQKRYDGLPGGVYTLTARDANGCTTDTSAVLAPLVIPYVELGEDRTVYLGDGIALGIQSNILLDSVVWSGQFGLSCRHCATPFARPYQTTTYTAAVTSSDGCTRVDSVTVWVLERRRVYVPNVFSPNHDGINDRLTVYGGPEVLLVRSFRVYTRWGESVFTRFDFPPNDPQGGWDGTLAGKSLPGGTYVWYAEVEFLDRERRVLEGSVSVLR